MTADTIGAGRYVLAEPLGHGGMAVVYRANDLELGRPVAVKVLAENLARDAEFRERFLREARNAARLSHPNVVHVYDAGDENGHPYIVMEYVPGETLADVLARRRKLPPEEATRLVLQAAEGLEHAHRAGLVHRDVKPQNLLVRDDGVLKIADFGIARAAEATHLTHAGTVLGTAAYLAPEQAAGDEVTAAVDVYSLGAVLYELLTGRTPYTFGSLAELASQQRAGAVLPVRDLEPAVPDRLEAVVMRCLARDPAFRPASAGELASELRAAVAAQPIATTVALPSRTFQSVPGAGSWWWITGAVAVALVAVILGVAHLGRGKQHRPPVVHVTPVARGTTPAEDAANFARWLRAHSR